MAGIILCKQINISIYLFVTINPFLMVGKILCKQINISIYLFVAIDPFLDDKSFPDGWKNSL